MSILQQEQQNHTTTNHSKQISYKQFIVPVQQDAFRDQGLFLSKKILLSMINPQKKYNTIYDKILISNKNDPLHPSSYRRYQSIKNTRHQTKNNLNSIYFINNSNRRLVRKQENNKIQGQNSKKIQFSKLYTKLDKLSFQQQYQFKDKKKFFKNLLQKFTQHTNNNTNSQQKSSLLAQKQKITLFKKLFDHYKIKDQDKQQFNSIFKRFTQKQSAQLSRQNKISMKINLQTRKNNTSQQKRNLLLSKQMFRLKDKKNKQIFNHQNINNNISEILTIDSCENSKVKFREVNDRSCISVSQRRAMGNVNNNKKGYRNNNNNINDEDNDNDMFKQSYNNVQNLRISQSIQSQRINNLNSLNRNKNIKNIQRKNNLGLQPIINKVQTPIDIKLQKFRQFLFALNFSNSLFVPMQIQKYQQPIKFYIGPGNNSNLIKAIFKKRFWFQVTKNIKQANFIWTQIKEEQVYERQNGKVYQTSKCYEKVDMVKSMKEKNQSNNTKEELKNINQSEILSIKQSSKIKYNKQMQMNSQFNVTNNNSAQKDVIKKPLVSSLQEKSIRLKKFNPLINKNKLQVKKNMDPLQKILSQKDCIKYQSLYGKPHDYLHDTSKFTSNFSKFLSSTPQNLIPFSSRKHDILSSSNGSILKQQDKFSLIIHNHLQYNGILGNKKAMFYILKQYCQLTSLNIFDIVPLTYHIKNGLKDQQYKLFCQTYQFRKKKKISNYWVMKPGEFSNRGNGIECTNRIQQIQKRVQKCININVNNNNMNNNKKSNKKNSLTSKSVILQSYITNPLLYNGRKFDIRAYMMITVINGKMKAYWYQQGYIRTSSYTWSLSQISDRQIHLTNDAVQKYTDTYGKFQPGNKLSYRDIQRYLQTYQKAPKNMFVDKIVPQMRNVAAESVKAAYMFIDPKKLQNNFQIFGFDFMLDSKLKPWLIQINTNPCLELGCPLLQRIIPNMLENAFRIALDPLFPPPSTFSSNYKYNIAQNAINYNKFSLIFDQARDSPKIKKIYQNVNLQEILLKIQDIQEDKQTFQEDGQEIELNQLVN